MFLFLVSFFAIISCVILILFLKFSPDKQHHEENGTQVDAITFLRAVRSTKPFPLSSTYGWKIYCICNNTRVWKRNLIVDNGGNRIQVVGCYVKLSASVQVVTKALKDITRFVEWRPGVESASQCMNGSDKYHGSVSHDFIDLVTANQKLSIYSVVVEQKNIERYWNREDNGCFWLLESSDSGLLFYILQPVEELESCCLTVVSHFTFPYTLQDSATIISSHAQSMRDYMLYRKMKVTPLLNIHIPQNKSVVISPESKSLIRSTVKKDEPDIVSTVIDDLTDSSLDSSSDNENSDSFYKKFAILNPVEKHMVLKKSNFILNPRSKGERLRSLSDTNTGDEKTNIVKQRSSTLPKDITSSRSAPSQHSSEKPRKNRKQITSLNNSSHSVGDDDVFITRPSSLPVDKNTPSDSKNLPKTNDTQTTVIHDGTPHENDAHLPNVPCTNSNETDTVISDNASQTLSTDRQNTQENTEISGQQVAKRDSEQYDNGGSDGMSVNQKDVSIVKSSPDSIRYITLANQCAADLLYEYLQVSNIDLKKPSSQQSATSGGWSFCGLENDVVILKKIPVNGSSVISFMGKGLVQASPQTVLETVKNPRTKFTYDETLKKVDVLNDVTEKIKIVYFYHEVINVFKKISFDFCIIQNERQDGDKFVLATTSVETGLPNPSGVQRAKMLSSGWVIEPVQKEKKTISMATYVVQIDFGKQNLGLDKSVVDELVSKQALGIAFLRQFLKPAKWKSRPQSSPVRRQQSSPVPRQQPSPTPRQQSSPTPRQQVSSLPRHESSPALKL